MLHLPRVVLLSRVTGSAILGLRVHAKEKKIVCYPQNLSHSHEARLRQMQTQIVRERLVIGVLAVRRVS